MPIGKMTVFDIKNWIGVKQEEKNRKINIAAGRTVAINKLKRPMQYRSVRGQSEPADTCKPAAGRTVEINKLKRQMHYRYEREQSEPVSTY